jgi:hypothetical protein
MCFIGISLWFLFKVAMPQPTKDLALEVIGINQDVAQQKLQLYYKITNNSNTNKEVPFVKIKLLSSATEVIESKIFNNKILIEPQKYALVMYEFDGVSDLVDKVDLVVGTKLGLILNEFNK